ncbi:MAG: DUF885 domain-containing protein [Pseudomonadota bacterium]
MLFKASARFWRILLCALLYGLVSTPAAAAQNESDRLSAFFDQVFEENVSRWPEWQTSLGLKDNQDKWDDISQQRALEEHRRTIDQLAVLRGFDFEQLDPEAQLSYRLFEYGSELDLAYFPFRYHFYWVTHLGGYHSHIPSFLISKHQVDARRDAEAYIARLRGVGPLLDQVITDLRLRADKGIVPPSFVFPKVVETARGVVSGRPFDDSAADSALWADFSTKLDALGLPDDEVQELLIEARAALVEVVGPAYGRFIAAVEALSGQAADANGVWNLPDGEAYYRLRLASATTSDLTPDQVHAIGLAEVARIQDELRALMVKLDLEGDLQDLFAHLRSDPVNFYSNDETGHQSYLADVRAVIGAMTERLGEAFTVLPEADLVVRPVEAFRAKTANQAFYRSPAARGDRPGVYYVNLHDMSVMPKSDLEALAYHESVPGHHLQIALAQEQDDLPKFRRHGGYEAFSEGWALYAEYLPKEMGFYQDPYADAGRLSWELLRAVRLVVDTGLHHKRWTRQQAIDYMNANTPRSPAANARSIDRYLVWPGQAASYKIGMLKILELRQRAKDRLGDAFDLRRFHDLVLANGALPLDFLDQVVEAWIVDHEG